MEKGGLEMRTLPKIALIAAMSLALMAQGGDGGPDEDENTIVYQANIQDQDNRYATIDTIRVVAPEGSLQSRGSRGFDRRYQNRIDYSAVPIFGLLSEARYDKEDFVDANQIGVVRIDGRTLAIVLDENALLRMPEIKMVAILNQDQAYETRGKLKAKGPNGDWSNRGRLVGKAYLNADGTAMALVRPFVVTDSAFW